LNRPERLARRRLALSIVSHGQGALVERLLADLTPLVSEDVEVLVTLNLPEDERFLSAAPYPLRVLRNVEPKGFGANHNQAFRATNAEFFAVLNPDVRLCKLDISALLACFSERNVGAVAPVVTRPDGGLEDSARRWPTPSRILIRVARRLAGLHIAPDYDLTASPMTTVDWLAGMFIVFRSEVFRRLGGFDERYFMYLEDADICRRLHAIGWQPVVWSGGRIVHDARRATLRRWQHLRWHVASLLRFFFAASPPRRA
jgi:GT2 family glycosyltransferase